MSKPTNKRKSKQAKGKTQERTPMQRVLVLRNNKRVLEWREWGS